MRSQILVKVAVAGGLMIGLAVFGVARGKKMRYIPDGIWGGPHLSIEVEKGSARVEYDCGHGTIAGPLKVDSKGRFSLMGTHVSERGGPTREGDNDRGVPARFTGSTDGKTLTVTVILTEGNQNLGTYTLTRGQRARLWKCQ